MYRVLIVDDEIMVRMGLKMSVAWEENGFEVLGEAANGKQALEIIEKSMPDIVITDVKMPVMDGLDLIKELTAKYPMIKILVLSNYNDFEYVKEALKNGAADYFLKVTVDPEQIITVLQSLVKQIEQAKNQEQISRELKRKFDESQLAVKSRMLNNLIKYDLNKETFPTKLRTLNLELFYEQGFLLFVSIPNYETIIHDKFENDSQQLQNTLCNFISGIVHERFFGEVLEYELNGFLILVTYDILPALGIDKVLAEQIKSAVKDNLDITVTVYYNLYFENLEKLRNLLLKLNDILLIPFYGDHINALIDGNSTASLWENINPVYRDIKKDLFIYLKFADAEKFRSVFLELLANAKEKKLNPIFLRSWLASLLNFAKDSMFELYGRQISNEAISGLNAIEHCRSFIELKYYYQIVMDELLMSFSHIDDERWREEILKVVEFLEKNYQQRITLEMASAMAYMNKSYFCRLFKKETGENFQDFLTKIRMRNAAELLLSMDGKVSEIADRVGYHDIFYFNRVFKNFHGLSPGEYRKKFSSAKDK